MSSSNSNLVTLQKEISLPKVKKIIDIQVSPAVAKDNIITNLDDKNEQLTIILKNVRSTGKVTNTYKLGMIEDRADYRLCWYNFTGDPNDLPWNAWLYVDLNQSCPIDRVVTTYYYEYNVTIIYEDNSSPILKLDIADSQVLTEGKIYKISGSVLDSDSGNNLTVKYKINEQQERIITTKNSDGITSYPFTKTLTFRKGKLYDGFEAVSSQLADGVAHTLSVWAEDNNGAKSQIHKKTFTVDLSVVNKEPIIYYGSIPSSYDFIKAMRSPIKQVFIKLEFYDSQMNYINEFSKYVSTDDIGGISVDLNRPVRRTFSFSLDNQQNIFNWGEDKLIWIDKRVKLYIGLKLPNGTIEYIPQGVFIISAPQDSHNLDGKRTFITGQDKMWLMTDKRGKFFYETKIETGTNIGVALKIIASKAGETLFNFDEIEETVPYELTYSPNDNLYKALEELSMLAKGTIYYDVHGYLRFKKIDLNFFEEAPITWSYKFKDSNERFYAGNVRQFDESNLANHIIVLGGSGQTAVSSYELVVDENNPLWKDNPYSIQKIGRITYFHNNGSPDSLLTTNEECKWRAKYELMKRLGYTERVSLNIAPVYLHDVGDVIEIEDEQNDVKGKYLLESFTVPINPAIMTCECIKYRKVIDDWNFI
jgi:hypothetical protein